MTRKKKRSKTTMLWNARTSMSLTSLREEEDWGCCTRATISSRMFLGAEGKPIDTAILDLRGSHGPLAFLPSSEKPGRGDVEGRSHDHDMESGTGPWVMETAARPVDGARWQPQRWRFLWSCTSTSPPCAEVPSPGFAWTSVNGAPPQPEGPATNNQRRRQYPGLVPRFLPRY